MFGKISEKENFSNFIKNNFYPPTFENFKNVFGITGIGNCFQRRLIFEKFFSGQRQVMKLAINVPKRETIRKRTIKYMKELGTYKVQYNQSIDVFVDLLYQYNLLTREFEKQGFVTSIATEKSGGKKSPILASLEVLRKDIGVWSDRLMLNPKAFKVEESPPQNKKKSAFAQFMGGEG